MHFNSRSWLLHCLPRLFPHFFSPLNLPILLNLAPFLCSSSFNPSMLSHSHEISMRKYHICYWKSYPFTAASIRIFPFQLLRSIKINIHFSNTLSKKTFWLCTKRGFVAITYKFVGNHLSMVLCLVLNYVPRYLGSSYHTSKFRNVHERNCWHWVIESSGEKEPW